MTIVTNMSRAWRAVGHEYLADTKDRKFGLGWAIL